MHGVFRVIAVTILLSGCADEMYQAANEEFGSRAATCVVMNGGTNGLKSVPPEQIVAAAECVNLAESETLIPTNREFGYDVAITYHNQAKLLELALLRQKGEISADDFGVRFSQLVAIENADYARQDAGRYAQAEQNQRERERDRRAEQAQRAILSQQTFQNQISRPQSPLLPPQQRATTTCNMVGESLICNSNNW